MNPRDPYAEALGHLDEGRVSKALDLLHWAGRNLHPLAYDEAWAEVHLHRDDLGKAAELAERTLRAGSDTPRIAAVAQWQLGLRVQARDHAEKTAEDDPWSLYQRALIAFEDQDWSAAEAFAGRSVTLRPEYTNAEVPRAFVRTHPGALILEPEEFARAVAIPVADLYSARIIRAPKSPPAVIPGCACNRTVTFALPRVKASGTGYVTS